MLFLGDLLFIVVYNVVQKTGRKWLDYDIEKRVYLEMVSQQTCLRSFVAQTRQGNSASVRIYRATGHNGQVFDGNFVKLGEWFFNGPVGRVPIKKFFC